MPGTLLELRRGVEEELRRRKQGGADWSDQVKTIQRLLEGP